MDSKYLESLVDESWLRLTDNKEEFLCNLSSGVLEIYKKDGVIITDHSEIPKEWENQRKILSFQILVLSELLLLVLDRINGVPLIYGNKYKEGERINIALVSILNNLTNTLISIKTMIENGFDSQAKVLLRWQVEISDSLCAFLYNKKMFDSYMSKHETFEEAYAIWRKNYTPKLVRYSLQKFDREVLEGAGCELDIAQMREDNYQWLSQYSHINYISQYITAFSESFTGEETTITLGGLHSKGCLITLEYTTSHTFIFLLLLLNLLSKRHGWYCLKYDKARLEWCLVAQVCKEFYINELKPT